MVTNLGRTTHRNIPGTVGELTTLPTPVSDAPRLASRLGISGTLLLKRDDLIGFAVAGNKARTLEPLVKNALATNATTLVTGGSVGSNFCQGAAAAAAWAGLRCVLVLAGKESKHPNLAAAKTWGAQVEWTGEPDRNSVDSGIERAAERLSAEGERTYVCPRGGANPIGAMGFYNAAFELHQQLSQRRISKSVKIVLATGSGGTLAGLVAGNVSLERPWHITGASVSRPHDETNKRVHSLAQEVADLTDGSTIESDDIHIIDARGAGHGIPSAHESRWSDLALQASGIILDPVYTAKALGALPEILGESAEDPALTTIFWHTGGLLDAVASWEHHDS